MYDPDAASAEAASSIIGQLAKRGHIPQDGIVRSLLEPYITREVRKAIDACVCPPSEGLGK